jgi:hypothetical protein
MIRGLSKGYKKDQMIARANEIEKVESSKNKQSLKDILKMHDRQVKKGLKTIKK